MTTAPIEQTVPVAEIAANTATLGQVKLGDKIAAWMERASEWFNPILVKESRQALKSRQFVITFSFMLLVTWIATIVAVTANWPTIYYLPYGISLLATYAIILATPLIIVVPFSAFRSLAVEREDGTFELVSVTSLSARQIITGKLGSAFVQIMVYCSAIAPCLVFTYLLRGVDLVRILFVIVWTIAISGGLCCVSLLGATFSRARYMQSLLSVGLIFLLLGAGFLWLMAIFAITWGGDSLPWGYSGFWAGMGYLMMLLICLSITCVLAASAQISFASDNHATPVRISLFFTQAFATGGFVYLVCIFEGNIPYLLMSFFGCGFWAIIGSFLIGDSGYISERVRRQLPASLFGRAMFSWFNPGGGTAYVFTCVTMAAGVLSTMIFTIAASDSNLFGVRAMNWMGDFKLSMATILAVLYVIAYLGASNLILAALRVYVPISPVISFVVTAFVAMAACLIPTMVGIAKDTNLVPAYDEIQAPNWVWTLYECLWNGIEPSAILIVSLYTAPIFIINVLLAYREIAATKTAVPMRVLEEERELHPQPEKRLPPQNPWDDGERAEAFPESP
jgi:hypothetical protein